MGDLAEDLELLKKKAEHTDMYVCEEGSSFRHHTHPWIFVLDLLLTKGGGGFAAHMHALVFKSLVFARTCKESGAAKCRGFAIT